MSKDAYDFEVTITFSYTAFREQYANTAEEAEKLTVGQIMEMDMEAFIEDSHMLAEVMDDNDYEVKIVEKKKQE